MAVESGFDNVPRFPGRWQGCCKTTNCMIKTPVSEPSPVVGRRPRELHAREPSPVRVRVVCLSGQMPGSEEAARRRCEDGNSKEQRLAARSSTGLWRRRCEVGTSSAKQHWAVEVRTRMHKVPPGAMTAAALRRKRSCAARDGSPERTKHADTRSKDPTSKGSAASARPISSKLSDFLIGALRTPPETGSSPPEAGSSSSSKRRAGGRLP